MKKITRILLCTMAALLAGCTARSDFFKSSHEISWSSDLFQEESQPSGLLPPEDIGGGKAAILAVGDLMVHGEQLADALDPQTGLYDFTRTFQAVKEDLSKGDLTIGNLETVLGGEEIGYSDYPRFNTPDSFGEALAGAGFDFLTTANNHCMDKDEPGLLRTLDQLDSLGLHHTGTYRSQGEQSQIAVETVNGLRVAIVSFTYGTNGIPIPPGKEYMVSLMSHEHIRDTLQAAKALRPDWIIALPHMGNEYETAPLPVFVEWIDFMISQGADAVLASHPHVLQPMELRQVLGANGQQREGFVIYSLGNFVSSQRYLPRETSIVLRLNIQKDVDGVTRLQEAAFMPIWVQFRDQEGKSLVRVLPIYDALQSAWSGENAFQLHPGDISRIQSAHQTVTSLFWGHAMPLESMEREYIYYCRDREEP